MATPHIDPATIVPTRLPEVLGPEVRVSETAGRLIESDVAPMVVATIHPSAVLRARGPDGRDALLERLVGDLRLVAGAVRGRASSEGTF